MGKLIVVWFSSNKQKKENLVTADMTPLQAVTHLCACIQLSDGDANFEERKSWLNTILTLFPSFSQDRADKFLNEAHTYINNATKQEFIQHTEKILHRVNETLTEDQIKLLGPKLKDLIEADGIVMNSEVEIAELVENNLSIKLRIDKDL